jgi:hypothetical protein
MRVEPAKLRITIQPQGTGIAAFVEAEARLVLAEVSRRFPRMVDVS